jgi:hypothetical protein
MTDVLLLRHTELAESEGEEGRKRERNVDRTNKKMGWERGWHEGVRSAKINSN